jgi:predicted anti-sigma-YlaC factor YlaD
MKCNDSQSLMMKFFDRDLNDIEEAQLKQHLKICTNCSQEYVSLKEIFSDVEQDSEIEPPEDFERQVMSRIENETKMYKKTTDQSVFVYNILLVAISFIFVIFFGGMLWESLKTPINVLHFFELIVDNLKDFLSSAVSMGRGIIIAIVGVTASIYKTYYYAYIVLGLLLLVIQRIFIKMVREGNGGAAQ